jgi:penicillin-binding protein 1C
LSQNRRWLLLAGVRAHFTPSDAYLLDRNGELIDTERVDFGVRRFEWVGLDAVSPALVDEIVNGEDRRVRAVAELPQGISADRRRSHFQQARNGCRHS